MCPLYHIRLINVPANYGSGQNPSKKAEHYLRLNAEVKCNWVYSFYITLKLLKCLT